MRLSTLTLGAVLKTLNDLFGRVVGRNSERVLLHRQAIDWIPISSAELYRFTVATSQALLRWDVRPGDRVAILSENRPEWAIADFASMRVGGVVVPIYPTLTDEQVAHILRDSGARVLFASTTTQLDKALAIRAQTPLEQVVVMDYVETSHAINMSRIAHETPVPDGDVELLEHAVKADDLATLIYTSGTTGVPKGVMLTHGNLISNVLCSLEGFDMNEGATSVSFLPLSHITARHVDYALLYRGATLAYCPFIEQLPRALREVRPDIFVGVPRVYEKIRTQVLRTTATNFKRAILERALATGQAHRAEILSGIKPTSLEWRIAERLVYSKIREGLGGKVQVYISGGAPLSREIAEWYADVGIRIHEGYGLTETSPVIAVNTPRAHKLGTVGKPLQNVEVRIAEDGEILVRGPSIFKAYWNKPQETQEAFADGFFKTGDIGCLDGDGFLSVTDRKKDLIKTSGGKFIAPQPIENSLKSNALVAEAIVIGEKRKFPAALIAPYFPLLEDWARQNSLAFSSREDLVADPRVQALYEGIVHSVNQGRARFEQLKKFVLLASELSTANGTLTPTLKLRRRAVEELYRDRIEALYAIADEER